MKISFAAPAIPDSGAVVVALYDGGVLSPMAEELNRRSDGALAKAVETARMKGKRREIQSILAPARLEIHRLVVVGLGKAEALDALALQQIGSEIGSHLGKSGEPSVTIAIDIPDAAKVPAPEALALIGQGMRLRAYRFDKYKTRDREKEDRKPRLQEVQILTPDVRASLETDGVLMEIAAGTALTKDLVSEPPNLLYPETLAERCRELSAQGVEVEILDEEAMAGLGMGALLGVGQGSERESRMVIMRWNGAPSDQEAPIAFIGKGVTFDTGGISLKPAAGMDDMKWDMGGAGVVIGLMRALAGRKARANVVGIVGLVENMPSGNAQRPGDIVTTMSGQTVEVLNTDAEGRLVLADALWYCQDRFKPKFMIDLATLTGAIIVSLGNENAGMFSNNDELAERLAAAGRAVGETVWRMPLADVYDKEIDSDVADMKNVSAGRAGGSITAAQFLQRFVNNVPWVHLDIAGVTWSKKDRPLWAKGGSGFGVRLLDRLVAEHYES